MLEEYKEALRRCADLVEGWQDLSKNDLCRKYVENKDNPELQNSYFAAIMYRYWHLIPKYYYQSSNVASIEDCYEWLEDSVYGCLKATSWDREDSSIYKDPNGPDKVINRCMKCARLTYYQFINRKKRKDNFGMLSLDEMTEMFGNTVSEPESTERIEDDLSNCAIKNYIQTLFRDKDYFVAVMLDAIQTKDVFDVHRENGTSIKFNLRKLSKIMSSITPEYIEEFAQKYNLDIETAEHGFSYITQLKPATVKAKIQMVLDRLQHDSFFKMLNGGA